MNVPPTPPSMNVSQPPPASKSSSFWKWLLIGCGGLLFVGILVCVGLFFAGKAILSDRFTTEPNKVETLARSLMEYDMEGGSKGVFSMDLGFKLAMVTSGDHPPQSFLMLAEFPKSWVKGKKDLESEIRIQLEKQAQQQKHGFRFDTIRKEEMTLCGQQVNVQICEGTINEKGDERPCLVYLTTLPRPGSVLAVMAAGAGADREAKARALFESLRLPR